MLHWIMHLDTYQTDWLCRYHLVFFFLSYLFIYFDQNNLHMYGAEDRHTCDYNKHTPADHYT